MSTKKGKKSMFPMPKSTGYIEVKTKEGVYRRRNRGTVKPAVLNSTMRESAERMKLASPAAKRMMVALKNYTDDLDMGRIMVRMGGKIRKGLKEKGGIDYTLFKDLDWQKHHPMSALLDRTPHVTVGRDKLEVRISLEGKDPVIPKNSLVDSYRFIIILLSGDPLDKTKELRTKDAISDWYPINGEAEACVLTLPLEKGDAPWLLWLRVECTEEGKPAHHFRMSGMRVLAAGEN